MDKAFRIYQCGDSVEAVLSAVYDAGLSAYGHEFIRIEIQRDGEAVNIELFSDYFTVESDPEKAERVIEAVKNKISKKAYSYMMYAALSDFADRGDAIYQFLTYGFTMGAKVCDAMQIPWVQRIFEIKRAVANEAHFFREFLRFQEIQEEPSVLLAICEPKHRVVTLLLEYFADRLPSEYFVILDQSHQEAAFHAAGGKQEVYLLREQEAERLLELSEQREEYVDLWKAFFEHIAIAERKNKELQRNLMPLHYRKHMTEFI